MPILQAMKGCDGSVTAAANTLLVPRKILYDKLKKHSLGNCRTFGEIALK
jgi:transcriptional regulator of acetoin/glycerol metabolism